LVRPPIKDYFNKGTTGVIKKLSGLKGFHLGLGGLEQFNHGILKPKSFKKGLQPGKK